MAPPGVGITETRVSFLTQPLRPPLAPSNRALAGSLWPYRPAPSLCFQSSIGFVETFKYFPSLEYPDNASVESWNDGPGTIGHGSFDQILPDDPKRTPTS